MKVSLFDLLLIYETEVKKNVRNKKKILDFEKHKMEYLVDIKNVLENNLYDGRKYNDYLKFKEENPNTPTIEMDTVYNNKSGPYIQTFLFEKTMFMFGLIHQDKTSLSMANGLDKI